MGGVRPSVERIAAIDPSTKGFGFALLEDETLVDWGLGVLRDRSARAFRVRVRGLLARVSPTTLVLEDPEETRRGHRARRRIRMAAEIAEAQGLAVVFVTRREARSLVSGTRVTKDALAREIADRHPALVRFLPKERRPWMSEDERMNIFDAISFALTALPERHEGGRDAA